MCACDHALGDAAESQASEPRMTMGSNDDELRPELLRGRDNRVRRGSVQDASFAFRASACHGLLAGTALVVGKELSQAFQQDGNLACIHFC